MMTSDLDQAPAQETEDDRGVDGTTASDGTNFRYPGSPPFQDTALDRKLFKGRADEIDEVLHTILSCDLFLLYGVSGLGKSSLLNAGILESLRSRGFWPVTVRLNQPSESPIDQIRQAFVDAANEDEGVVLSEDPSFGSIADATTLWDLLSRVELWRGNTLLEPVIIFDQFEELFTLPWDRGQRDRFIAQFGEVVRGHRLAGGDPSDGATGAPNPKIVLVIREDHLGELEAMSSDVPQIMRRRFRLGPLDPARAEEAIREPALLDDPSLDTERFTYSAEAAQEILDFLGAQEQRTFSTYGIDPSQLQLVCQYVEQEILPRKRAADQGEDDEQIEITGSDLGGRAGLEEVLRAFYQRTVELHPVEQRPCITSLCETGLINEDGRRLSLEVGEIAKRFEVDSDILRTLVQERLLRSESRVGSVYYELAHDTLVEPIRTYRMEREAAARRLREAQRRRLWGYIGALVATVLVAIAVVASVIAIRERAVSPTAAEDEVVVRLEIGAELLNQNIGIGDSITYEFETAGEPIEFFVRPTFDVALDVVDAAGIRRNQDQLVGAASEKVLLGNVAGVQRVTVRGVGTSSGRFEARIVELTSLGQLSAGTTEPGRVESAGDLTVFEIDVDGDGAVVLQATPTDPGGDAPLDVTLELLDPDGNPRTINAGTAGEAESVPLTVAGTHLVAVGGSGASIGGFTFSITDSLQVTDLTVGQRVDVSGDDAREGAVFAVDPGITDDLLAVEVVPTNGLDVALEVTDTSMAVQRFDIDEAGGVETALLDAAEGRSLISVEVVSSASEPPGGFEIGIGLVEVVQLDLAADDAAAVLTTDAPAAAFDLTADSVDPITVELSADHAVNIVTTDPNGRSERQTSAPGQPTTLVLSGVEGSYRILATRTTNAQTSVAVAASQTIVRELELGTTERVELGDGEQTAVYQFTSIDDRLMTIEAIPEDLVDVALELTSPSGLTVSRDDLGAGDPEVEVFFSEVGEYELAVRTVGTTSGVFEIGFQQRPWNDQFSTERFDSGFVGGPGEIAVYPGLPGGLEARVTPDSGFDVVLEVVASDLSSRIVDEAGPGAPESTILETSGGPYWMYVRRAGSTSGDFQAELVPTATPYRMPTPEGLRTDFGGVHDYPATDIFVLGGCGGNVVSPVNGEITEVVREDRFDETIDDPSTRGGRTVSILGDDGVRYYLAHFDQIVSTLVIGERIDMGARLGSVGQTGRSSACHIHFGISPPCPNAEWWVRRGAIDPEPYLEAWARDEQQSPAAEVEAWSADNPNACEIPPD